MKGAAQSLPQDALPDARLAPALDWFARHGWRPFDFQREAWLAYLDGQSGLIHAATGSGKTLAAWLGPLLEWRLNHAGPPGKLAPPLQVLWVTPMRALAADTLKSLEAAVAGLGVPWTAGIRTGDTTSGERARQKKRLPTALVTTPESLSLLLSHADAREQFAGLKAVIVDEWHELLSSKRGVQLELALAHVRGWGPDLRTWGVSATLANLPDALRTLLGTVNPHTGEIPQGTLIQGERDKTYEIRAIIPPQIERFPWAGHLGLRLLPEVVRVLESSQSALVFTNTRFQTETWFGALLDEKPEWAGEIALHHSALSKSTREFVENGLKEGTMRCVVCTSSLDLGVDFAPVDSVLQIGSPKGAARLLQRAGRSGHQPNAASLVTCVPTHALELIEVAAARDVIASGVLESRPGWRLPLDVLAQHLVTMALGGGFTGDAMRDEVRSTTAFRDLSDEAWTWVLDFVCSGGAALTAYPEYHRVERDEMGRFVVHNPHIARLHRMSVGTIVSDAMLKVKYLKGGDVGFADESFLSRLKPGDRFTLGGKVLEFVRIREMTAWVRRASSVRGVIPRWGGGNLPLSAEMTDAVRARLEQARSGMFEGDEMRAVRPIMDVQARWSRIPARDELLIERTHTREGFHTLVYPFAGRLVHEGLAALCAYRLSRVRPGTFSISVNDYGFELLSADEPPLDAVLGTLFSPENLLDDIIASLNASEMAKRQFREIARVAGLVVERFPGGQKSARQLQATTGLLYDVFEKYDPENLLLEQAKREVLERQLEITRLEDALRHINAGTLTVMFTARPTPFAFPLLVERMRATISSETVDERVRKMQLMLERAADDF
ncbi:MAG: ligase-associated DNA damage response DEXH box helicase [Pleurocapsa minor GSE-CHR-MK-17-07R]|nr:ligase-associated DNA damage response DEXH box helicase [Pleurocapsa minor GSE-CHR-MK 17-07R]